MSLPHSSYPLLVAVFLITRSDVCSIEIGCMGVHSYYFSTHAPFLFISFFFFILDIAVNNQPRCLRGVFHHIFNVNAVLHHLNIWNVTGMSSPCICSAVNRKGREGK